MDNFTPKDEMMMRYLDGLMEAGEKAAFEKQLAADSSLQEQIASLQLTTATVKSFGIKEQVAAIHEQMMKEFRGSAPVKNISPNRTLLRRIVAVAASVIFIVLVWQGLVFYNLSASKVFNENYISYSPDKMRDNGSSVSIAEQAYMDKNYQKVIELTTGTEKEEDILLAAHANLALNNVSAAITGFKKIIESGEKTGSTDLKETAEYNLILSYIRNRDYDLALGLMNDVKGNPNHLYHDKMTGKLFRQVKMLKWR